jgi:biotin carboxyl carrier protein
VDGQSFSVAAAGPGGFRVTSGTRQWLVYAVAGGDRTWVACEGVSDRIALVPGPVPARPATESGPGALTAPMPATVVQVHVAPGQAIKAGDLLVSLEAMKMELPIRAPAAGIVRAVLCRAGELVQPDVPLLEIA